MSKTGICIGVTKIMGIYNRMLVEPERTFVCKDFGGAWQVKQYLQCLVRLRVVEKVDCMLGNRRITNGYRLRRDAQ